MINPRMKRAFEVKKTFFLVSQELSFRITKQTSRNKVGATLKVLCFMKVHFQ